jgi:hypothetical protein
MAFQASSLGITGALHIVRPEVLRTAAGAHRATGALPRWLSAVEWPAVVGFVPAIGLLAGASVAVVAIATGSDLVSPAASRVVVVSMLAAVAAGTLLVAAGAAGDPLAEGTA